ncbi:glycosyl transferase family 90 [Mesorhizobium wenxiniae]|uniref:glycosyl transferase family 90 n=1 Tax=Mesorhizobium wenxiniae TaxID=2014805 RepID=UPI00315A3597
MYYYDLKEFARYFDPDLRIDFEFGDVIEVPAMPSIVKDRPIAGDNRNGVLFKLNKFRHFHMPADDIAFADKLPVAVWRGELTNPIRTLLLEAARDLPFCDVGTPKPTAAPEYRKSYLSIDQQRRCRYIIWLEGNDVATNLKWIMSSNSLCLMPPTYETWFAESELVADVHHVPLEPDFTDLPSGCNISNVIRLRPSVSLPPPTPIAASSPTNGPSRRSACSCSTSTSCSAARSSLIPRSGVLSQANPRRPST